MVSSHLSRLGSLPNETSRKYILASMQESRFDESATLTILFIHLGTEIPRYLISNIERSRVIFPKLKISLVTDSNKMGFWVQKNNVEVIKYQNDEFFDESFTYGKLESSFRNGYWRHTTERLAAIKLFHNLHPETPILHIESDILMMPDFPVTQMSRMSKIHWLSYGASADIAAIFYSPHAEKTNRFYRHLIEEIKSSGGSDMELLWNIRERFPNDYLTFPTINPKTKALKNVSNQSRNVGILQETPQTHFDGIFDAAGIGIWLCGGDPRNNFGFTTIHTRELIDSGNIFIDSSKEKFVIQENGELRIETKDNELIPVFNLHIHSKNKKLLSKDWEPELAKMLRFTENSPKIVGFDIRILATEIYQNLRHRSLLRYLLHAPILKNLKRKLSS